MYDTQQNAARALIEIYKRREDLRSAFPEAEAGDVLRLLEWAAGVCAHKWSDPALLVLQRYAQSYSPEAALNPGSSVVGF
jgi:hypothetical protein